MAQLMPLPLTISCSSKIQIGFTFLVPAHLGSPGTNGPLNGCVCVCVTVIPGIIVGLSIGLDTEGYGSPQWYVVSQFLLVTVVLLTLE